MKTYTLHVSLPGYGRLWRKIELPATFTLEDLHWAIQNAYDFDGDHLYSFFMSGKAWDTATEYTLNDDDLYEDDMADFNAFQEQQAQAAGTTNSQANTAGELDGTGKADDEALADFAEWYEGNDFDEDDEDEEDEDEDEDEDEEDEPAPMTQEQIDEVVQNLQDNPEFREQVRTLLTTQMGMPAFLVDMALNNAGAILSMLGTGEFEDLFGERFRDEPGSVRETSLEDLNLKKGQEFMYLFDYGDSWRFKVRVHAINENADASAEYPRIVQAVGDAPVQYGGMDDEEDLDEELGEDDIT